jgi:hypothetical protein
MKTAAAMMPAEGHKRRSGLRCQRCNGLMLPVRLYDQSLGFGPMDCWGAAAGASRSSRVALFTM